MKCLLTTVTLQNGTSSGLSLESFILSPISVAVHTVVNKIQFV